VGSLSLFRMGTLDGQHKKREDGAEHAGA
jgi:hypothetical protein